MFDDHDDNISNPVNSERGFNLVCERRFSRRDFVKTGVALGVGAALPACSSMPGPKPTAVANLSKTSALAKMGRFDFVEIPHGMSKDQMVAPDHQVQLLIRWGDPIFEDAPQFDVNHQTVDSQMRQFGYNNDYIGYLQLAARDGEQARALLCVNHEYPQAGLMFPALKQNIAANITAEQVAITQAAVGNSIIEVVLRDGRWAVDLASQYNRRITALETVMQLSGPVAGNERVKTTADPDGTSVIGTFNNCAGGMTPWGTYLTCEENFNFHFSGTLDPAHPEAANYQRYNMPLDLFHWGKHDKRFDLASEPNEPNRFGWVVEIDPLDPRSTPKKRTALGRLKHEGAENVIAADGRLVVYMGDDQRFEYLYKFVSRDPVNLQDRSANTDLLDHGTLYVARFNDDGTLQWLSLSLQNPLLSEKFASQADILLEPRRAADLLQATPMDRPEDVVPDRNTGKVYAMLSNNSKRVEVNAANPRSKNMFGHIAEITEANGDFAATTGHWDLLVKCGDPARPEHQAQWHNATSASGWFASPDNGVIDPFGRLWVTSDQGPATPLSGTSDGLWALETEGDLRATGRMFYRAPLGAEVTGPVFSEDGENLFIAVQHPGDLSIPTGTTIKTASTRWPDFNETNPPRPSLIVVRRKGGGKIA